MTSAVTRVSRQGLRIVRERDEVVVPGRWRTAVIASPASVSRTRRGGQFNLAQLLPANDRLPETLDWLDRALARGVSGSHVAVTEVLSGARHPELRRAAQAHRRCPSPTTSSR